MAQPTTHTTPTAKRSRGEGAKSGRTARTVKSEPLADLGGGLTFITSEGEILTFPDAGSPPGDAAALAGEEAIRKIWDRPAEELAWRDM